MFLRLCFFNELEYQNVLSAKKISATFKQFLTYLKREKKKEMPSLSKLLHAIAFPALILLSLLNNSLTPIGKFCYEN